MGSIDRHTPQRELLTDSRLRKITSLVRRFSTCFSLGGVWLGYMIMKIRINN